MADKMSGAERCGTRHQGDEVALDADVLYIRISRNLILGIRFVPCIILAANLIEELLNEAKELAEWQTLFADVIRASEDSDDTTLDGEHFNRWQQSINMPLRTPGRVRTRLMGSLSEDSEISDPGHVISQVPNTPEVDMGFEVDPGTFEEATQSGIPETVVMALRDMAQAVDKANLAILGLHRNFGAVGGVMADDLHALDIRVQSLQTKWAHQGQFPMWSPAMFGKRWPRSGVLPPAPPEAQRPLTSKLVWGL
jgi:hypothetical protein